MSCNCHEKRPNLNTWGCGCNKMPEEPQRKGVVKFCDICDPCNQSVSNVRLCAFVVPTLEDGRYYKNSFIFVQEDDSTYYISDDRSEIPFGSRPKFIDNFEPDATINQFKNAVVFDMVNKMAYIYGEDRSHEEFPLGDPRPVGTVYTSTSDTAPDFQGTWEEIGTAVIGEKTVHYYERTA